MAPDDHVTEAQHAENAEQRQRWLEENRDALLGYNLYFEEHECFSEGLRSF